MNYWLSYFLCSSRRRQTICALVTGVQTCARPISVLVATRQMTGGDWRVQRQVHRARLDGALDVVALGGRQAELPVQLGICPATLHVQHRHEAEAIRRYVLR